MNLTPMAEDGTVTWAELLAETAERLQPVVGDIAGREARWICEEVSGATGSEWHQIRNDAVTVRAVAHLDSLVQRRMDGEPLQYVLGSWSFRGLDLAVDRRALIPRPETEVLVDVALAALDQPREHVEPSDDLRRVLDLGTGTGAIAIAIASERRHAHVWATDASEDAVALARANVAGSGRIGARIQLLHGSWFEPLADEFEGQFDLIVTNPPYVADDDEVAEDVRLWEPAQALWSGSDGFADLDHIIANAGRWLSAHGVLAAEIGPAHGERARKAAVDAGFIDVEIRPDLAGRDRYLVAYWLLVPSEADNGDRQTSGWPTSGVNGE